MILHKSELQITTYKESFDNLINHLIKKNKKTKNSHHKEDIKIMLYNTRKLKMFIDKTKNKLFLNKRIQ
jgi:hypothetical protein